ncbi:hypothetical protein D9757_009190 [Collybiopsis confluens]|uniref:Uncharacterized protein n=1 Tax=Collybiopsis confluens TaxID=2823264 RepID=A0A8H5M3S5_9AGAR|nr:hypothetical protein D9757_009190 [Collybiopsis confluens]
MILIQSSRHNMDSDNQSEEASSLLTTTGTTFSSFSVIPGLGYISGKAIHRVGSVVVDGIDAVIIRRRLAQIEAEIRQSQTYTPAFKFAPPADRLNLLPLDHLDGLKKAEICRDLLELSRAVYGSSIQNRANRLFLRLVALGGIKELAVEIATKPTSHVHDLLKPIFIFYRSFHTTEIEHLKALGYDPRQPNNSEISELVHNPIRFILFLGMAAFQSPDSRFSQLLMDLDIAGYIVDMFQFKIHEDFPRIVWSVVYLLIRKLDAARDASYISELERITDLYADPSSLATLWKFSSIAQNAESFEPVVADWENFFEQEKQWALGQTRVGIMTSLIHYP